ncbi:MAG: hypothetical protein H7Z42_21990 [Roseiflexaceae bacterium]|nr:hypothetical protein [Roseiflexaceae bacterium]
MAVMLCACASAPASPTPRALPSPVAPSPTPGIAFAEQFDGGPVGQLRTGMSDSAAFANIDDRYQIKLRKPESLALSSFGGVYTNLSAEVEVRFAETADTTSAALLFRLIDEQNFYAYSVSGDGFYALEVCERGQWRTLIEWTRWPAVERAGGANKLRVLVRGDQISLFLNDKLLVETVDATFTQGRLAFSANTYALEGAVVTFDNLVVQPLNADSTNPEGTTRR